MRIKQTRMNTPAPQVILGIAPCSKGFGFAILESGSLVEFGLKTSKGNKNAQCLEKIKVLLVRFKPHVLVVEHVLAKESRRAPRIKELGADILTVGLVNHVPLLWLRPESVKERLLGKADGTKHELAATVARRFPEELGDRVPRKRRAWDSQDSRLDVFYAVALAMALWDESWKPAPHIGDARGPSR